MAMAGLHSWYGDFDKVSKIDKYVIWLSIQSSPLIITHNNLYEKVCSLRPIIVSPEKIHERIARSSYVAASLRPTRLQQPFGTRRISDSEVTSAFAFTSRH